MRYYHRGFPLPQRCVLLRSYISAVDMSIDMTSSDGISAQRFRIADEIRAAKIV
jgi:hypothetical protein